MCTILVHPTVLQNPLLLGILQNRTKSLAVMSRGGRYVKLVQAPRVYS